MRKSFFFSLLQNRDLVKHDGRPLWKYFLTEEDRTALLKELRLSSTISLDPRDVTLYYAEWWRTNYNGGIPSKKEIFNSVGGNIKYNYDADEFYQLARTGAVMLGITWLSKQNTLYFRTLLLQGGLPLKHISENQSKYQNFLLAVLEEQPETIEDFIFNPYITDLLPKSSQNEIIYESCFEIVKSLLNDEPTYDELLQSSEALSQISKELLIKKSTLTKRARLSKPKNYWLLAIKEDRSSIHLKIGLGDIYSPDSLSNILGFEVTGQEYQFFLDDILICIFRKLLNSNYKTDWYQQQRLQWDGESIFPNTYVFEQGKKIQVPDFIQTVPDLSEPTLWTRYSESEWRLVKGNGAPNKEGALLYPQKWKSDTPDKPIALHGKELSWLVFEGEAELEFDGQQRNYFSDVSSFDWTIETQKPSWILKANMPVVQKKPRITVYDENNKKLPDSKFKVWLKKRGLRGDWRELSEMRSIPSGCIDIKIEKDGLTGQDQFFNIGNLQFSRAKKTIDQAQIQVTNPDSFEIRLEESPILEIEQLGSKYYLQVKTEHSKIPKGIMGSVGYSFQKKLNFEIMTPFEGMTLTDSEGEIIPQNRDLSLGNLYGLRVLSTPNSGTILRIKNILKPDVVITKEIFESAYPLISLKDEVSRLFYLSDAMDYKNRVRLEIVEGRNSKAYHLSGFSHTLDVGEQLQKRVRLYDSHDELELFAIPLNVPPKSIEVIPLVREEYVYTLPSTDLTNQFIVISSNQEGKQLMPRFVNTNENYLGETRSERIENYHVKLSSSGFDDNIWKEILAYLNICIKNDLPFSTLDQLRAISRSSKVAAKAFFYFGVHQLDSDFYIQKVVPEIEKDLGIHFFWIDKKDWHEALYAINDHFSHNYFNQIFLLINSYMKENGLSKLLKFMNGETIETNSVYNSEIIALRSKLGERVLRELPRWSPKVSSNYNLPVAQHTEVVLLLRSGIAVAESILGVQTDYPIWGGDDVREAIRRNIQYSHYLNPEFHIKTILHVLQNQ